MPGEVASRTQPIPSLPAPYTQQSTTIDTLTNRTPEAHAWAVKQYSTMIGGGQFIPPSVDKLTVDMPGFAGGDEWGGVAIDPATGVLYVNANDTAWLVGLTVPQPAGSLGEKVYQGQCSACHGMDRAGAPPAVPALDGIEGILTDDEIAAIIRQGRGRMPPFNSLSDEQVRAVVRYLTKAPQQEQEPSTAGHEEDDMPYKTIALSPLHGSGGLSGHRAALGHSERDRREYRPIFMEDSLWRVSRAVGQGDGRHRIGQLRWAGGHRWRSVFYRCDGFRPEVPRV